MIVPDIDVLGRILPQNTTNNYPYTSSFASSAASSTSSVFSVDAGSSQSSAPSSSKSSLHTGWESETSDSASVTDYQVSSIGSTSHHVAHTASLVSHTSVKEEAVAIELRQHPRRTQRSVQADPQSGCPTTRPPPSLIRQCDRKDNFVESLVDTTTQMIEVIWPLSVTPCGRDAVLGGKNLIGLRTFIQEVLKRSKTSYSTLQVALYYLILIKSCIPRLDFTMEQSEDSHVARAMQCGRRMFLAALILASKYLQDRNYSARAWSKISGLKVSEINTNEMAFVTAVDWKLHVPEPLFQRWTDVVLKFSPPTSQSSPAFGVDLSSSWRSVVPLLTPQLDEIDGLDTPRTLHCNPGASTLGKGIKLPMSPPGYITRKSSPCLSSNEATPTMSYSKLLAMEPSIQESTEKYPRFPPISPRISLLPTPQMTPQSANFSTPAVSASGFCPVRSMSLAWKQVQNTCMMRSTLDTFPSAAGSDSSTYTGKPLPSSYRSSSLARTASSVSSPESMVSDLSSRSSRSSSISSVASSVCALPQPRLAVQATRRCANMQLSGIKENCMTSTRPSPEIYTAWEGFTSSPVSYAMGAKESYVRDSRTTQEPRSSLQNFSDQDAAEGLRDLALNRHGRTLPPLTGNVRPATSNRKRERPNSISDPGLQQSVRGLLQPQSINENARLGTSINEDDGTVLMDTKAADSFMLSNFKLPQTAPLSHLRDSCGSARKRPCHMEGFGRGLSCAAEQSALSMPMPATGPGMWAGIL